MGKSYRPYLPEQGFLLPPSLREWLPENHLVYFVSDVVDHLNLAALDAAYGDEQRGQPPYDPRMMTKVLVYGYCVGVFSSRRIERRLAEDVGFRVLAAGNTPNFRTIADFRKLHLATLAGLFEEVLQIALEAGALKLGRVALDGTKVQANASKHKAMSYGRMQERERQLRAEVRELLAQAEAADAAEDAHYGADRRGDELPAELQRRETRLKKIRAAQRALEERERQSAEKAGKPRAEVQSAKPADKEQYNFTDPESRLMKGSDGLVQGYNAQAAVEPLLQLIVGQSVTPAANDKQQIGRVENWRAHGRWRVSKSRSFDRAVGSQFRLGHVSSSRHVKRSGRISRTPLSCPLRRKVYEAYHAGSAFGAVRGRRTRYWLNSPNPSYSQRLLHLFQPKPRRFRARIRCRRTFFSTHSLTKPKHRLASPMAK